MKPCLSPKRDELLVRFPDKFDEEPENPITQYERATQQARPLACIGEAEQAPQQQEKSWTFQCCFIELARIAGKRPAAGEYDAPGQCGWPPPKLAIHKIGQAAEEKPDRRAHGNIIDDPEPSKPMAAREKNDRHRHAHGAAMK